MTNQPLCAECERHLTSLPGADRFVGALSLLRSADETARSAARFAADPAKSSAAGRGRKLRSTLAQHLETLRGEKGYFAPQFESELLASHVDRVEAAIVAALSALDRASRDSEQVAKVSARVVAELVPARFAGRIVLDAAPVLLGIAPHRRAPRKVQEVLDAFAVPSLGGTALLLCPRFVVDYMNRFYAAGGSWNSAVVSVDAAGMSEVDAQATGRLWDPFRDGPLADLAQARDAAVMVLAPVA